MPSQAIQTELGFGEDVMGLVMGAWFFGYRYLNREFKRDDADLDITLSGLEVGYGFRF